MADTMQLPYGATELDFERCKNVISKLINDKSDLDETALQIMNVMYSTGGDYSEKTAFEYAKMYLKLRK